MLSTKLKLYDCDVNDKFKYTEPMKIILRENEYHFIDIYTGSLKEISSDLGAYYMSKMKVEDDS